jgi:hypothetical protein
MLKSLAGALSLTCLTAITPALADTPSFDLKILDDRLEPAELRIPANTAIDLKVTNGTAAAAEIESDDLRVEKVIPAGETATLRVRPAKPGQYKVVNEFKESVSGVIVAE